MATRQIMSVWLGGITLLWALQPLLWSHARGVLILSIVTVLLALMAQAFKLPVLTTWSGAVGLCLHTAQYPRPGCRYLAKFDHSSGLSNHQHLSRRRSHHYRRLFGRGILQPISTACQSRHHARRD
jgi:hypothetical protein